MVKTAIPITRKIRHANDDSQIELLCGSCRSRRHSRRSAERLPPRESCEHPIRGTKFPGSVRSLAVHKPSNGIRTTAKPLNNGRRKIKIKIQYTWVDNNANASCSLWLSWHLGNAFLKKAPTLTTLISLDTSAFVSTFSTTVNDNTASAGARTRPNTLTIEQVVKGVIYARHGSRDKEWHYYFWRRRTGIIQNDSRLKCYKSTLLLRSYITPVTCTLSRLTSAICGAKLRPPTFARRLKTKQYGRQSFQT